MVSPFMIRVTFPAFFSISMSAAFAPPADCRICTLLPLLLLDDDELVAVAVVVAVAVAVVVVEAVVAVAAAAAAAVAVVVVAVFVALAVAAATALFMMGTLMIFLLGDVAADVVMIVVMLPWEKDKSSQNV